MRIYFKNDIQSVFTDIKQAQYAQAYSKLNSLDADSKVEKRIKCHAYGIISMREGKFLKAIEQMQEAIELYGAHISLLSDLSAAQFLAGQIYNWQNGIQIIEKTYGEIENQISLDRKITTLTSLAKFKEELGEVDGAIKSYKITSQLCEAKSINPKARNEYIRALSNILRLKSQHHIQEGFFDLYKKLVLHSKTDSDWDVDFETQHSLILSEFLADDIDSAFNRANNFLKNPLMDSFEKNLLYVDLAYYCHLYSQPLPSWLQSKINKLEDLNYQDRVILDIVRGETRFDLNTINSWSQQLAPAPYMRILLLLLKPAKSENSRAIHKKLLFTVMGLAPASQKIWREYIDHLIPKTTDAAQLKYSFASKKLACGTQELSLSKKQSSRELLELLIQNKSLTIKKAILALWGTNLAQDYDISRLKMRVLRLNRDILKLGLTTDLILIKGDTLLLSMAVPH